MKNSFIAIVTTLFFSTSAYAGALTIPNTFTTGTPALAAQVNANFSAAKTAVDDNNTRITANAASAATNATNITANAASAATNATNITANAASTATNAANITTNAASAVTNAANITANAASAATNAANITANAASTVTNAANITANAASAATNAANITANAASTATNAANITTNAASITTNATDIATNTASITALQSSSPTRTIHVYPVIGGGGVIDQLASGNALIAAVATITNALPNSNQYLVKLGPGYYDLGTQMLSLPDGVSIEGSGSQVTIVGSTIPGVVTANGPFDTTIRALGSSSIRNIQVHGNHANGQAISAANGTVYIENVVTYADIPVVIDGFGGIYIRNSQLNSATALMKLGSTGTITIFRSDYTGNAGVVNTGGGIQTCTLLVNYTTGATTFCP